MTMGINLLPETIRKSSARTRVFQIWSVVLFFGMAAVGAVLQYRFTAIARISKDLMTIKPDAEDVLTQLAHVSELEKQLERHQTELAGLDSVPMNNGVLPLLNTVARGVRRFSDRMVLTRIEFVEDPAQADSVMPVSLSKNAGLTSSLAEVRVLIHGTAESDITVGRFVQAMRDSSLFQNVTLRDEANPSAEGFLRRRFVIECQRQERP